MERTKVYYFIITSKNGQSDIIGVKTDSNQNEAYKMLKEQYNSADVHLFSKK